ncbi:carboxy-S-adenosyl-L-methionine synthase CmoA [Flocculibacter collagenilyticus]|uniref:carboxy-S-adenosyl-L-methionine synthase CmoA n=1 Tax=Flocculibacter collagenilyticus TaxID=2744479 RepID=UPI00389939E7
MSKDSIYSATHSELKDFTFDETVVEVFPDMIQRSVPGYSTIISTIGKLTEQFHQPNSNLYDLGCSLGAVTLSMRRALPAESNSNIIAVDNSSAMLERCKLHLQGFKSPIHVELVNADINDIEIENASIVVLNFTLQFISPEKRLALLQKIYDGMRKGGLLIISEKLREDDDTCHGLLTNLHHDFKRANGYSELEISQKRSALENVMKPDTRTVHYERFQQIGFSHFTTWYQCFNFCSMAIIK